MSLIADLGRTLDDAVASLPGAALRVGYSGGLDSTVLLHALARSPAARARGLAALHVDHGLHPASGQWAATCAATCDALQVPCELVRVEVRDAGDLGLEGAARAARHAAFARHLPADGVLVLAQHRDDQAETLLLRLLHGGGHEGLAGMRPLRPFGHGSLWRPLLDLPRDALRAYAERHRLDWIEDPSNADARHARNHLRLAVLPALRARWPDASARIGAAAARLREEADLLQTLAGQVLAEAQGVDPATLDASVLRRQPAALRRLVVGRWLDANGLPRPPPGVWTRLQADLLEAAPQATPRLAWRGAELRRYRHLVYALAPLPAPLRDWTLDWDGGAPLPLPSGFGRLALDPAVPLGPWQVAPRRGGERLAQPGAHRELRTLLQDLGVPPWVRERLPLLSDRAGTLLAAGDLALAPAFAAALARTGTRLVWTPEDATPFD